MSDTLVLNPKKVEEIFLDCLYRDGEDTTNHVLVEGIVANYGLHPERLESHREEVIALLAELPDEFRENGGGGWSFLNACNDRHGNLWTGLHSIMEQLIVMGVALGLVHYQLPKEMWSVLPGGMPYFSIRI